MPPRGNARRLSGPQGCPLGPRWPPACNSRASSRGEPPRRLPRETHVPTPQSPPGPPPRISSPDVHPRRPCCRESSSTQGPATAERLIDSCRSRADFIALRRGRRFESDALWISFALDPELDRPRVAFAIGRRQGTAVARNRVRRRLREVLREHPSALIGGRYLIGTRQPASTVSYRQARTELLFLLEAASAPPRPAHLAQSDLAP